MKMSTSLRKKRVALATALAGLTCIAAWAAISISSNTFTGTSSTSDESDGGSGFSATAAGNAIGSGDAALTAVDDRPRTYIVVFRDAPLATYQGSVAGIAKPARKGNGRGRIDAASPQARAYVKHLEGKQRGYEGRIDQALGRQMKVTQRMQHALNAIVTSMSPLEAEAIGRLPEVQLVEAYREYAVDTDIGPQLVGATNVWQGISMPLGDGPDRGRGEGVVVGILDTGINFGSPSFAAVDPTDGYVHTNPNGAGNYLGTCAPGGVDAGRCNDKLIGGWDFICGASAPANACGVAGLREEPGFGDTNGHGSHTASTAAGNRRPTVLNGAQVMISGVAPRANLIAYDVCYTNIATGQGSCPNVSSVAAVNQAIADGVDVINFSIGGGAAPWNDAVSLAFLNATNAGVFVATSAGNSGPGAATLGHVEPWTMSSAASRHRLGGFTAVLAVSGPSAPPANLQRVLLSPGSGGVGLQNALPATTPVVVSPGINSVDDGCLPYAAGQFQNAIAVIRRGTCSFTIKTNNAAAAGALVVVLSNNTTGGISPSVPGTTIPAFGVTQAVGNALRDYAQANGGATAGISIHPNAIDALGDFSSRGPGGFDVLKPDITAPGVDVLAVYAGTTVTGFENLTGVISGTSMASPHTAGAAALMRQLHPSWTVPEIKSALAMTATRSVLLEDQVTPADAQAAGSGRLQVDIAARAGLVLNETTARFVAANPAVGGEASALNLAAIQKANCTNACLFVRTVRSTLPYKHQWRLKLQGFSGTIEPASLTLKPGESREVLITIKNTTAPADGSFRFGSIEIAPSNSANGNQSLPSLHMPIALRVPPPPPASTIPLANGVPIAVSGAAGSQTYYSLVVPAGASQVSFVMQGGTGDADLYVKWGEAPTSSIDCGSETGTNNETCTLVAKPGTYYVRIAGFTAYTGATLTGSYQ
jgi:subtilisin family serine protease